MKKLWVLTSVSVFLSLTQVAHAQSWLKKNQASEKTKGWIENFEQAKSEAKQLKQPIFVLFTGSDWCPWCMKLEKEVLSTKAFKSFAEANLILFKADYLQGKKMRASLQKQNDALKRRLGVRGFPTVFLLNAEEEQLGKTGYRPGGGEAYVNMLKEMLEAKGIKTVRRGGTSASLSPFERMKAEKAERDAAEKQKTETGK